MSEEILKGLDLIGQKIDAVSKDTNASVEAVKSEMKTLGEKQLELSRELASLQQKSAQQGEVINADKSVGAQYVNSNAYQALKGNVSKVERAREIISTKAATTSTVTTGITRNTIAMPTQLAGIYDENAEMPLVMEGLIPHIPVASSSVQYLKASTFTNNAKVVAEGAVKPESTFQFKLATANVETIAHYTKITEQLAQDAPAVQAFINAKMIYGLQLKIDEQLVNGTGAEASQLTGLLATTNSTDYSADLDALKPSIKTMADFALAIKTKLETNGYAPKYLILNPIDWAALALMKDTNGLYILGGPAAVAGKTLWGMSVVTTPSMPQGKYLMSDFALGATIFDRQEVAVEIDREQDDFTKNLFTIRVERRLGLAVENPKAIGGGAWTLPTD
jgi:HK97 family phage major capsid protein|nr:MAG TPA: major capsid protein [Caudoviricetes sp.]